MAGAKSISEQMAITFMLAGALAGCGVAAKVNARNDMEASKAAYKACLAQHPQDVGDCAGPGEAYQADLAAYRATSAGLRPGPTISVEQREDFAPPLVPPPPLTSPPPTNAMSIVVGPNGQAHPCLPMGPMMTVCN
jgi:hypothetical protein